MLLDYFWKGLLSDKQKDNMARVHTGGIRQLQI